MFSTRYYVFFIVVVLAIGAGFAKRAWYAETTIIQSPQDHREYRYYQLANGLKVLLIADAHAKQASAALSVDVGSGDDPKQRQGLAHFLEHMLFLGTKPYPEAGEYQAYISRHGGFNNAFTAYRQTTYHFSIDNQALEGALDRFAPFFISPLFSPKYVARERNAVEAEYRAKIRNDFRRVYAAKKQAFNPQHPHAQFSVGGLETLSDTDKSRIRDDVIAFYHDHYSSERMSLVVAGDYPLATLKEWVDARFSTIAKRHLPKRPATPPLLVANELAQLMQVKPIKNTRSLNFVFPMPESDSLYAYKPIEVIANLLGHEGQGSLLALFKQQGWAEGLSAGKGFNSEFASTFELNVRLTEAGLKHVDDITQAIFTYSKLLYQMPDYLFKEQQRLNELAFKYHEQEPLSEVTVELSGRLLRYPAQDVLYGQYRQRPLTQAQIKPFLDSIRANNMLRTLVAPEAQTEQVEKWYQTKYRLQQVAFKPEPLQADWVQALFLPKPNPFIPEDLNSTPASAQNEPSILLQTDSMQAWYYPEHKFNLPKTEFFIRLQTHALKEQAKAQVLASLLIRTVGENLNAYTYPASLSGLSFGLSVDSDVQIILSGYQDKMPILLDKILTAFTEVTLTDEQFMRYKKSLKRELQNIRQLSPYKKAVIEYAQFLLQPKFNEQEWLQALATLTKQELLEFAQTLRQQAFAQVFIHTTSSQNRAQAMLQRVRDFLPASAQPVSPLEVVRLPKHAYQQELGLPHADKLYAQYIQGADNSDQLRASYALLGSILSAPYYQALRTEQQLGYIVFATPYPQKSVPGLLFLLQSPNTSPNDIRQASQKFFTQYAAILANMSEQEFASYQRGLVNRLRKPADNMQQKAARFWRALMRSTPRFNEREELANKVQNTRLSQIQALYQRILLQPDGVAQLILTQGGQVKGVDLFDTLPKSAPKKVK